MTGVRGSAQEWLPGTGWDDARWQRESLSLRAALGCLNVPVELTLPGEPGAVGASAADHYAAYLGLLIARVHACWQNLPPRLATAVALAASAELDQVGDLMP